MKRILFISLVVLMASCKSDYEIYTDQDSSFRQLNEMPDVFIIVKRDAGSYFKIVHFNSDWEFLNGVNEGNIVHEGYYIADGEGFNGYDLQRKHSSLDEAITAAQSAGHAYDRPLGEQYNYQSGGFYRNSPFKKLSKK